MQNHWLDFGLDIGDLTMKQSHNNPTIDNIDKTLQSSLPKTLRQEWIDFLGDEFSKPYFATIITHYKNALKSNQEIFPPRHLIFNAFNLTPPNEVKIVILGQDPYHGVAFVEHKDTQGKKSNIQTPQAMGLSFSVPQGVPIPPSLKNIYKELQKSTDFTPPLHGDLSAWAQRGVLLLNAIFSVQKGIAGSHRHFGWEIFSDSVIHALSSKQKGIIFMLWGNYAKKKASLIDSSKHTILQSPHPSPLARGFVGSGIFVRANEALKQMGKEPFDWSLP